MFASMTAGAPLSLNVFGELELTRRGERVGLPRSKKTRALLAYLAATGRPQRREHLCSLLWEDTDDPQGNLRWSLTKLRSVIDDGKRKRLVANERLVELDSSDIEIDAFVAKRECAGDLAGVATDRLERVARLFRGEFLDGLDLPDSQPFHAWWVAQREDARRLRAQVLAALIARGSGNPAASLAYARELAQLDPLDEPAHCTLLRLLVDAGRHGEADEEFEATARRLKERGSPGWELRRTWAELRARVSPRRAPPLSLRQEIRFCRAHDGVRIAYATVGEGPALLKAANWLSHLEADWNSPVWSHFLSELCRHNKLVRYDERGTGLSDWKAEDISFEAFVADLEAVVEAAGLDRFALFGLSQGCAVSIAYAVRHPERVTHLVLLGGFARGWRRLSPETADAGEAVQVLLRQGWGSDNPAFRQLFTSFFIPDATPEQMHWFNELERVSASPDNAARIFDSVGSIDVTELLPKVKVPTLVLHCVKDCIAPYNEGLQLATSIPGARFVSLDGNNHVILEHESAWPRAASELHAFLANT